jgi:hypothetical protein
LLEGQIKASSEIFEQQRIFVRSIRDAWKQVRAEQLAESEQAPLPQPLQALTPPPAADATAAANQWSA